MPITIKKSLTGRLRRLTEKYQEMAPRLVQGVIKSPLGNPDSIWIQKMVDWHDHLPNLYSFGIPERVQKLYQLTFGPKRTPRYEVESILRKDVDRALVLVLGLKEQLNLTAAPFDGKEILLLFRKSVLLAWSGKLEKYWKHQVSWIFARWMKNPVPETPTWWPFGEKEGFLLGGRFRNFQTCYLHGGSKKHYLLAKSLLEIKRVAESVAVDFIKESLDKHRVALTCQRALPAKEVSSRMVLKSVALTVREVFPRRKELDLRVRVPSLSSHYSQPGKERCGRKERGAVGYLVQKYGITRCPSLLMMVERSVSDVRSIYASYDPEDIRAAWYEELLGCYANDLLDTEPIALPEPFKVRVITKGPVGAYWIGKSYQKVLHDCLRRHPTFRLVGEPCSEEIVDDFLWKCSPNDLFNSGDYEASTDNLDPDYSDFALCCILGRLGCPLPPRGIRNALVGHMIHYEQGSFQQEWGQLMGSPISFPVLCIMNAALSRLALDPELTKPLRELPMLVNGDDILMGMSPAQYDVWNKITTQGGLKPSLGKNYLHRRFLMINSELYEVKRKNVGNLEVRSAYFRPFINLGLMKGEARMMTSDPLFGAGEFVRDLAGLSCALVKGHTTEMKDKLMTKFIKYNRSQLDRLPPGMSWFLPRCAGGYGLPLTRDVKPSAEQLKVAAYVRTGQGNLALKHVLADQQLRALTIEEDQMQEDLGNEWCEGGSPSELGLMRVNWPALAEPVDPDERIREVKTNFGGLRRRALATSLHPMDLDNALEEVRFGWSREISLHIPALNVGIL